jgi:anaerobic magnesium-protoporphyrin IX monomethyl ester cyclase
MKICLITPPSGFLLDQRVFMSLGILKVGAVLEQAGYEVEHLDLTGVSNYVDVVNEYVGNRDRIAPSEVVFALTATTPQMPAAIDIRKAIPGKAILGGPHPTLLNAAAKRGNERAAVAMRALLDTFDTVVAGDGEHAIFRALREYGCIDADDPKSLLWEKQNLLSPWPARHLVDVDSYRYAVDGERALSMIAQLGCPFECGFCGGRMSPMLRRARPRQYSIDIISEMVHLHETYGVKGMMFLDDELNVNKGLVELMRGVKKTGIDWRLRGFVKAELFTDEQAEALYAAGFRWLLCGFESAHPRILRNINKKSTLEDNTRMLHIAHRHGLKVKGLMSVGHPGEGEDTVLAIRDWLLQEKPDDFDCTVITVYPGTPYYDRAVSMGDRVYRYEFNGEALYSYDVDFAKEAAYYKGVPGDYRSFVWTDHISAERLVAMRDALEDEVRTKLNIPYPTASAAINYEHSMGMNLPPMILRKNHGQLHYAGPQSAKAHQAST